MTAWAAADGSSPRRRCYVYFDSKNALCDALYAAGYRVLLERDAAVPRDVPPEKLLRTAERMFV